MSYCLNPQCQNPRNLKDEITCRTCGSKLLLKERYRAIKPIGSGGFARTYSAIDEDIPSHSQCVIKQLHFEQNSDPATTKKVVELFHREAERLDVLGKHPRIPTLLAHLEQDKQLYLVQELIVGHNLEEELERYGVFDEQKIWKFLQDFLPILKFVHDRESIHRDIKPLNIMRRFDSPSQAESGEVVLIDFGIAKSIAGSALLKTGTVVGSPEYIAPEQLKGKAVPASDLYSLGVTCIYLLTGISPFNLFDNDTDRWIWRDYLLPQKQVGDRLGKILDKLLLNAVKERYQSVDEVLQAVTAPTSKTPTSTQRSPSPPPAPPNLLANLWQQYLLQSQKDELVSAIGIDYTQLQRLLTAGKWQQADLETQALMCQAMGKLPTSYLQLGEIDRFPCEDLQIIDQLWMKSSNGRFGFSIQKQIYEESNREYQVFCDRLGWPVHNPNFPDSWLKYTLRAPLGHLPSRRWAGGYDWWRHADRLTARLEQCQRN
jgi:serine/threonine protein kinase